MGNTQIAEAVIIEDVGDEDLKVVDAALVEDNTFDDANDFLEREKERLEKEAERKRLEKECEKKKAEQRRKKRQQIEKIEADIKHKQEIRKAKDSRLARETAHKVYQDLVKYYVEGRTSINWNFNYGGYVHRDKKEYATIKINEVQKIFDKMGFGTEVTDVPNDPKLYYGQSKLQLTVSWAEEKCNKTKYSGLKDTLEKRKQQFLENKKREEERRKKINERNHQYLISRAKNSRFYMGFFNYMIKKINIENKNGKKEIVFKIIDKLIGAYYDNTDWREEYLEEHLVEYDKSILKHSMNVLNNKGFKTIIHKGDLHVYWDEMEYDKARVKFFENKSD